VVGVKLARGAHHEERKSAGTSDDELSLALGAARAGSGPHGALGSSVVMRIIRDANDLVNPLADWIDVSAVLCMQDFPSARFEALVIVDQRPVHDWLEHNDAIGISGAVARVKMTDPIYPLNSHSPRSAMR